MPPVDHALLASVRRSLRALNRAIEAGCRAAGLTVQQQALLLSLAFLLSVAATDGSGVPLVDVRADLGMDQATISELVTRMTRRGLVHRSAAHDRRAAVISLTAAGRASLRHSMSAIRREIRAANARGELRALRRSLRDYLAFHTG